MEESITLTKEILERYGASRTDYFVETGTFYGGAVQLAIDTGFSEIISIEIDPELFDHCFERFYDDLRVQIFFGDSLDQLPLILDGIDEPITFWLDAHAGNSPTAGRVAAPLLEELAIIAKHRVKKHVIMIDDVRLMGKDHWANVTREKVIAAILSISPYYVIHFCDSNGYPEDILVAVVEDD